MKKFFVLLALVPAISFGAIKAGGESLDQIRDELSKKAGEADKIAASIKTLEKQIGKVNNNYLERVRVNRSLSQKLETLKDSLGKRQEELDSKEAKAQEYARLYALESQDEQDQNALLKKTILSKLLKERIQQLNELKVTARELQDTYESYSVKLDETKANEDNLYSLIVELENKKRNLSQNYISSLDNKNELEEKLENALAKRKAYKVVKKDSSVIKPIQMIPPIEKFVNYRGGKKGVTFKYESRTPIKASAGGKVVYSGELASYGKVIMVDHGQEVRSVILGDIQIKVKKGDSVNQGQVLGYTMAEPGLKKSLYYEVRKKNIAQNTLQWLENAKQTANI